MKKLPRSRVTGDVKMAEWRLSLVQQVLRSTEPRTAERAARTLEVAQAITRDWRDRPATLGDRTLRGWIARYETKGMEGLMRKAPRNAGAPRVQLSRNWDRAMQRAGVPEPQLAEIVSAVRKRVRSLWRSGTPSWPTVQMNALPLLVELTRAVGVELPNPTAMHALCEVPRRFVEAERRYAILAMKDQDAAQFAAKVTPRIRRDRSHLRPCEYVAGDVHHIDILFRRPDGTECTPKAVAWLDLATNRTWFDIFIMPKGEMIRTEHVIQSFVAMCSDPNWGAPSRLYLDNGSEYKWTHLVSDIAKLKHHIDVRVDDSTDLTDKTEAKAVQHARPYNAQAKVIETLFAGLEKSVFPQLPGYIGGNRMQKKTANQGRAPEPFPGDEDRLREAIATAIAYYHAKPQAGHLNGMAPNDSFSRHVRDGWHSTVLNAQELAVAFSHEVVKPVRAGGSLRLDGTNFRADALQPFVGARVLVRKPLFGGRNILFVFTEHSDFIGIAEPEGVFAFGDPHGAGEQSRRAKALRGELSILAAETEPLDGEQSMARVVALHGPASQAQSDGVISVDYRFAEAARAVEAAPAREAEALDQKQKTRRVQFAVLEEMDRMAKVG